MRCWCPCLVPTGLSTHSSRFPIPGRLPHLRAGVLMATMPKPRVTGAVSVFGGKENALPGAGRAPTGPGAEPSQASEGPRDDAGVEGTAGVGPSGSVVRKSRNVPIPGPTGPIAPVTGEWCVYR